jgi:hypothetical protein
MSLLPSEDHEQAVILSLWQDQEALDASEKGAFAELTKRLEAYLAKPPSIRRFRVFSTELFQRHEKPPLHPTK